MSAEIEKVELKKLIQAELKKTGVENLSNDKGFISKIISCSMQKKRAGEPIGKAIIDCIQEYI